MMTVVPLLGLTLLVAADPADIAVRGTVANEANAAMQIVSRGVGAHAAVDEACEVGNVMVAEKAAHLTAVAAQTPRTVERGTIFRIAACVPPEADILRAAENAFVCGEPLESQFHRDFERLIRNRTF